MLRFTIIDYTTDPAGVSTVIDEPVGWDGINLRLKRDKTWHGFFDFADDTLSSLHFVGTGYAILKDAYETYGMNNNVQMLIEYQCADGDGYNQLYLGRFVFSTYKEMCGDECAVEIGIEAVNCFMIFKNRYDQQVDLDSLNTFDNICEEYDGEALLKFVAPNTIIVLGQLEGVVHGTIFTVTGSVSNNGTFTVVSYSYDSFYSQATMIVEQTVVDEDWVAVNLQGCVLRLKLSAYTGLNMPLTLTSKVVFLESKAQSVENQSIHAIQNPTSTSYPYGYLPDGGGGFLTGIRNGWFTIPVSVTQTDLSTFNGSINEYVPHGVSSDENPSPLFTLDLLPICPSQDIRIRMSFTGTFVNTGSSNRSEELKIVIVTGDSAYMGTIIDNTVLYSYTGTSPDTQVFNYSIDQTVTLNAGQSIFYYFFYDCLKSDSLQNDPVIRINNDVVVDLTSESQCQDTHATVYMINESLSRCTEAYTNDCLRVYSDYFGRTDSQPYAADADGCGSLRCITNGLRIRNAPNSDGSTPQRFNVSMQDLFNALNATDNIGMGLEDDPNRYDHKLIRVEPYEYFYNNTILMECDHIRQINKQADLELIFSTIKMGYTKWKTWNINGLNDIFTPRQYRTELAELKNELDRTCQFIASDYAIEWTRRQYGLTTADSRYDNDIFFVCLTREPYAYDVNAHFIGLIGTIVIVGTTYQFQVGDEIAFTGTVSNNTTFTITAIVVNTALNSTSIVVAETVTTESPVDCHVESVNVVFTIEQGVDNSANILYPDTVMNYRLAPSRNAMRWMKTILQSYRQYLTGQIIFTAGEGNILGEGEVLEPCRIENDVIAENQNLSLDNFADAEANYPLFYPELLSFEYPMTYEQYLTVYDNPYGLIGYQCSDGAMQYGWIEDMQYSPYNGMVNFTLRPKIEI